MHKARENNAKSLVAKGQGKANFDVHGMVKIGTLLNLLVPPVILPFTNRVIPNLYPNLYPNRLTPRLFCHLVLLFVMFLLVHLPQYCTPGASCLLRSRTSMAIQTWPGGTSPVATLRFWPSGAHRAVSLSTCYGRARPATTLKAFSGGANSPATLRSSSSSASPAATL